MDLWIGAGTSGNQHGWYIPAGGVLKFFDYPTDEVAVWNNGWGGGYYFLSKADFSQCVYYTSGTLSDERPNHFPKVSEISYFTNVMEHWRKLLPKWFPKGVKGSL